MEQIFRLFFWLDLLFISQCPFEQTADYVSGFASRTINLAFLATFENFEFFFCKFNLHSSYFIDFAKL